VGTALHATTSRPTQFPGRRDHRDNIGATLAKREQPWILCHRPRTGNHRPGPSFVCCRQRARRVRHSGPPHRANAARCLNRRESRVGFSVDLVAAADNPRPAAATVSTALFRAPPCGSGRPATEHCWLPRSRVRRSKHVAVAVGTQRPTTIRHASRRGPNGDRNREVEDAGRRQPACRGWSVRSGPPFCGQHTDDVVRGGRSVVNGDIVRGSIRQHSPDRPPHPRSQDVASVGWPRQLCDDSLAGQKDLDHRPAIAHPRAKMGSPPSGEVIRADRSATREISPTGSRGRHGRPRNYRTVFAEAMMARYGPRAGQASPHHRPPCETHPRPTRHAPTRNGFLDHASSISPPADTAATPTRQQRPMPSALRTPM